VRRSADHDVVADLFDVGMRATHQLHVAATDLVDGDAVIHVQQRIGMRFDPLRVVQGLGPALGGGKVRGDQQQVVVHLPQRTAHVAAQIDEEQPRGVCGGCCIAEPDAVAVDAVHGQPAVDMQALGRPEPVVPQLRVGVFDPFDIGEGHVVDLDPRAGMAPAEHEHVQHIRLLRLFGAPV
jgi:hypothetical protein